MILRCLVFLYVLFTAIQYTAAQTQYKILYNVLEDREKDNYEIYSMNMDGSDKKISPIHLVWSGYIMRIKTEYITSVIKIPVIAATFFMKWMQKVIIKKSNQPSGRR